MKNSKKYCQNNSIIHSVIVYIVASIPACHAGDRGSICRDGVCVNVISQITIISLVVIYLSPQQMS